MDLRSPVPVLWHRFLCCLCLIPILIHELSVWLDLPQLLTLNHQFPLSDPFEKMQKLWVLEAWIRITHHSFQHWCRATQDVALLCCICFLCCVMCHLHYCFISPLLSLLRKLDPLKLLLQHLLLHPKVFLRSHPWLMMHGLHTLLFEHCSPEWIVHHLCHLWLLLQELVL